MRNNGRSCQKANKPKGGNRGEIVRRDRLDRVRAKRPKAATLCACCATRRTGTGHAVVQIEARRFREFSMLDDAVSKSKRFGTVALKYVKVESR